MRARGLLAIQLLAPLAWLAFVAPAQAGTFITAAEGVEDRVSHPRGYTGSGGTLDLTVCIDPTSANATAMETPLQNAIGAWTRLVARSQNLVTGPFNNLGALDLDFESVLTHELGHCIGLGHPNLGSESGETGADQNYTRSTNGFGMSGYDLDPGVDGIIGSDDDQRGDDVNLHWFRIDYNHPFQFQPVVADETTMSRDLADLPGGHDYAANGDRAVAQGLGFGSTECIMQQQVFFDEEQRELVVDDVMTLRYGEAGIDEEDATSDDYTINLIYGGQATGCDIMIDFDNVATSFASCTGTTVALSSGHVALDQTRVVFNTGFSWYFNVDTCGDGIVGFTEECDDGNLDQADGCNFTCNVDAGWNCLMEPSACTQHTAPAMGPLHRLALTLGVAAAAAWLFQARQRQLARA